METLEALVDLVVWLVSRLGAHDTAAVIVAVGAVCALNVVLFAGWYLITERR